VTREDLTGRLALDTSALIELVFSTPQGARLRQGLKQGLIEAYTSELSIAELRYVLCRKLGLAESGDRVEKLLASGYINVEDLSTLIVDASRHKCERAISLADCFCIALAEKTFSKALFAEREKDLIEEIRRKPFDAEIIFLEDYVHT